MGALLLGMAEYVQGGRQVYSFADALQDMDLCLKMEEAMAAEYAPVKQNVRPGGIRRAK